jgi:predicted nuclease with TOPRIM domain
LLEQAEELKKKIYSIWDELDKLKEEHNSKLNEYEEEQEKIKYIEWAK